MSGMQHVLCRGTPPFTMGVYMDAGLCAGTWLWSCVTTRKQAHPLKQTTCKLHNSIASDICHSHAAEISHRRSTTGTRQLHACHSMISSAEVMSEDQLPLEGRRSPRSSHYAPKTLSLAVWLHQIRCI